jgi:ElaB/YqjD/DUF883 family membrane-anchored ribosome-binding protein
MKTRNAQLEQDMRNVVSEVEDLLATAGQEGSAGAREIRERVLRTLDTAKDQLAKIDTQVRSTARNAVGLTDDYVHDSPWQAIGVGALFGLLAGLLIARR